MEKGAALGVARVEAVAAARAKTLLKLASGPAAFVIIYLAPLAGLSYQGRVALATFAWAVVWWLAQPIPWAITSLLPLVIFPPLGVMEISDTAALYGQNIFFWVLGTTMLGYAMEKHGLAKRFALRLLSVRGVASTSYRLVFFYMLVTGTISMFVSDAATIAMMIPIAMSIFSYVSQVAGSACQRSGSNLAASLALGTLYAAAAGGVGTIAGIPHNAVGVALAEKLAGRSIGWFQWMMVGVPLYLALLACFYLLLCYFLPPEFRTIPGGEQFIRREASALRKMTRGEINVLSAFICMVVLFTFPSLLSVVLGAGHPLSERLESAIPIWVVPPAVLLLLFILPVDSRNGEGTLVWRDAVEHAPWNIILLCTGAMAMTDAMAEFGFMDFMRRSLSGIGMGPVALPVAASLIVALSTNFVSGLAATSLFGSIFIPMSIEAGFNPASMAMLVPNVALGIMFPWAGAAAGTAFASGYIEMKKMIKVGIFATLAFSLITALIHLLFAPIF